MKIEVLFVAECPSHSKAIKLVRDVLIAQGVSDEIREVLVADERMANELRFLGSPTIRINGRDVAGELEDARNFALSCRLYSGSEVAGLPPAEMIHHAVREARRGESQ